MPESAAAGAVEQHSHDEGSHLSVAADDAQDRLTLALHFDAAVPAAAVAACLPPRLPLVKKKLSQALQWPDGH